MGTTMEAHTNKVRYRLQKALEARAEIVFAYLSRLYLLEVLR